MENDEFIWDLNSELALLDILKDYKPAGLNKHFNAIEISNRFFEKAQKPILSYQIWAKLKQFYDLEACDERAKMPLSLEIKDFALPQNEYGQLMQKFGAHYSNFKPNRKSQEQAPRKRRIGNGAKRPK